MADPLLADPRQLLEDASLLDAWAHCRERQGGSFELVRRAAAALREAAVKRLGDNDEARTVLAERRAEFDKLTFKSTLPPPTGPFRDF